MEEIKKLEELTPEQEALCDQIRDQWLDFIFSCKNFNIDKVAAEKGAKWMYEYCGYAHPTVIFVGSPKGCQEAMQMLHVIDPIIGYPAKLKPYVDKKLKDRNLGESEMEGDDKFTNLFENLRKKTGSREDYAYNAVLKDLIEDLRGNPTKINTNLVESYSIYGNVGDYGWVAFFEFFTKIGVISDDNFQNFHDYIKSGVYDCIQLERYCIISPLPTKISRNANHSLHCADGPAIQFPDGYKQYYWNGIKIPEFWIEEPGKIDHSTIKTEDNAERRRIIMEIVGNHRFAELLDIQEMDRDHVNDQDVILYRTKEEDDLADDYIWYVKVICHSTKREYFLPVPPDSVMVDGKPNAWGAVAWTFGMTNDQYMPLIET